MPANPPIQLSNIVLDASAVEAFANEIAEGVENSALACIFDDSGKVLWQQSYQSGAPDPEDCWVEGNQRLTEPAKRALGQGNFAFDFPLTCGNVESCLFSLVVYTMDPPSLSYVSFRAAKMLACIARQVDVDATLSTVTIDSAAISAASKTVEPLPLALPSESVADSLQRVVELCYSEGGIQCVAAVVPRQQTIAIACDDAFDRNSVDDIAMRLHGPLEKKRKVISAPITLADGSKSRIVCAPIINRQQSIDGMALLISSSADPSHSKMIRMVASKIAKLQRSQAPQPTLLNRGQLIAKMTSTLSARPAETHSLLYFDNDKMHAINDAFGYSGGDRALATFRRILVGSAGASDSVAHLNGDRFAIFLPGASGDTAVAKATQVLQFLAQESIDDGAKAINLSASAGIVDTSAAKKGAEDMLILAEVASRGAQERGGNQTALFQDIDSSIIQRRSDVDKVGFLQMALLENRFVLHAQRIEPINAEPGQKFELLARLDHEGSPDSSPAQYLSAAERYQLMSALDRWVINSALTTIAGADNSLEVNLATFCINVSAQSLQDEGFVDFIEAKIAETNVPPDTLCFELTETSLVRHIEKAQRFVHRLQRMGSLVALDDFGTGYSSFSYLKTLPVNFLKIDGSFVRDLLENDLSKTIVNAVVNIADVIGAETVAEHVENGRVQDWLAKAGVNFIQGFVVHRPEPFAGVLEQMDALTGVFENEGDGIDLTSQSGTSSMRLVSW